MSTLSISPVVVQDIAVTRAGWFRVQTAKWRKDVAFVLHQIRTLTLLLRHPKVPWHARLVAGCAVAYLVSPIQLIPTFIPVIGQMDDLLVLFVGMKLLRKLTPPDILAECEQKARHPIFINVDRVESAPTIPSENQTEGSGQEMSAKLVY